MDRNTVISKLELLFRDKLEISFDEPGIARDADLVEAGRLDSLGFLVLVNFVKKNFKKDINIKDINGGRLNSFNGLVDFITES